MTRRTRTVLFVAAAGGVGCLLVLAFLRMPAFGGSFHPYRDLAVPAAVAHATANVVSSVNFDQRGLDTFVEESILFASVLAVATLLRPAEDETERRAIARGTVLESTVLAGVVLLPITLVIGLDVITHGHLTPGGGFQGGVVVGTGIHLLYVAGTYRMLERVRPVRPFEWVEALGAGSFAAVGIAGVLAGVAFLEQVLPNGTFGTLFSGGTVPLLNGAVGVEVASGVVVLLGRFFEQVMLLRTTGEGDGGRKAT